MYIKMLTVFLLALVCGQVYAAAGSITILSPTNGAMFSTKDKVSIKYEAMLGPDGNHWHLNVDGRRVDILRQSKGTAEIDPLSAGKHHICLDENTVSHVPTGVEACVDVSAQ